MKKNRKAINEGRSLDPFFEANALVYVHVLESSEDREKNALKKAEKKQRRKERAATLPDNTASFYSTSKESELTNQPLQSRLIREIKKILYDTYFKHFKVI